MRIAEGAEGEGAASYDERGSVADMRGMGGEEHDIADYHKGGGDDEEYVSLVDSPAQEW